MMLRNKDNNIFLA